jgi:serine/threonine-protein kinase
MGEVALVEDRDIGRSVAVKRLLGDGQGPAELARFVDEVRTVGRLEHPNIVPIHDVGVDENGALFFVMKYVDGETLEGVIARLRAGDPEALRTYDVTRCAEIFVGILRALQFAHERGVIHRDIKPANVMIGRFGEVVLMDWGVARPIGGAREGNAVDPSALATEGRASMTHAGSLIGTPLYMSPEQTRGQNDALDARSDLYAASVVFHELANRGHHRFENVTSLGALLVAIQSTDPPGPAHVFDHASVGAEYVHFVRRALARDPAARWQSAAEMIHELHLIAEGTFRVQCPMTLTKRTMREIGRAIDRRPFASIALVATSLLVVMALFVNALRDVVILS